jgi:valyl-tRNA synthetase
LAAYDFSEAAETLYSFVWHQVCDVYIEIAKDRAPSRAPVLAKLLTTALQLLHPLMPFVTEELWQRLPHDGDFIGQTAWPGLAPVRRDAHAAAELERLLGFVETVRALRAIPKVPYRELRDVHVAGAEPDLAELLVRERGTLERLARVAAIHFDGRPSHALSRRFGSAEVLLPVDAAFIDRENAALRATIEKSEAEIAIIERKLGSSGFVAKAPPEVVTKERERLVELYAGIAASRERLAGL